MEADDARKFYGVYVDMVRGLVGEDKVQTGQFQAKMVVRSANDGPVTLLHSKEKEEVKEEEVREKIEKKK